MDKLVDVALSRRVALVVDGDGPPATELPPKQLHRPEWSRAAAFHVQCGCFEF